MMEGGGPPGGPGLPRFTHTTAASQSVGGGGVSADLAALVLELLDGLDERADARERQRPVGVGHHGGPDLVCAGGGAVVRQLLRGAEGLGGAKGAL